MHFPVSYDDIALTIPGNKGIYIPAEDSFLLLDLLKQFVQSNATNIKTNFLPVLDMGAGSGIATMFLVKHFKNVHVIDINPHATKYIRMEAIRVGIECQLDIVASSLFNALRAGFPRYFLACFNPPYLPREDYEDPSIQDEDDSKFYLDKTLYANDGGRQVLESFLKAVRNHIDDDGHVFFIKSSLTGIDDVDGWISKLGFRIVNSLKIHRFFEDIEAYHAIA